MKTRTTITKDQITSIAIRNAIQNPVIIENLGSIGEGDQKITLIQWTEWDGAIYQAIETNGDPVWEYEDGFGELWGKIMK